MSKQPDPSERIHAVMDAMADAVGTAVADLTEQLKPFIETASRRVADPLVQAEVLRRQVMRALGLPVPRGCHCQCEAAHPEAKVCDGEPVTATSRHAGLFGDVQVPTCAPCAAEVITQAR